MNKNNSYLYEREYITSCDLDKINCERELYWEELLGKDLVNILKTNHTNFMPYLCDDQYNEISRENKNSFTEYINFNQSYRLWKDNRNQNIFYRFVEPFVIWGLDEFKNKTITNQNYYTKEVLDDFVNQLAERLQSICSRTLIAEIHEYKDQGLLQGDDSKEEYAYFCSEIVSSSNFIKELEQKYPVLFRCIGECIEATVSFYVEIICNFKSDLEKLKENILIEQDATRISHITSRGSDLHNSGKQVMLIELDNEQCILYKPHSMKNEKIYEGLYNWIQESIGLEIYTYNYLLEEDYSWSSIVRYQPCQSEEEVKRYYQRIGIHLFLAYILGTNDLHFENIIASGEFPVLIDLETIADVKDIIEGKSVSDAIFNQLIQSVLYTGLLPNYRTDNSGLGIDSSGIAGNEQQQYSFKVPRIMMEGTSEMYIDYVQLYTEQEKNRVMLNGENISPIPYIKEIEYGFENAYETVQCNQDYFMNVMSQHKSLRSRALVADTQRYAMLLSSSYHPSLLQDGADREIFLYSLWEGRDNGAMVDLEVRSLLHGDIPYFYRTLDGLDLCSKMGSVKAYFHTSPYAALVTKVQNMSTTDMNKQCELIRASLELIHENKVNYINHSYCAKKMDYLSIPRDDIKSEIDNYINRLLTYAVWNQDRTEVNWTCLQLSAVVQDQWHIQPMDMYLYSGLSGMLYLFYCISRYRKDSKVERIYETLRDMMFQYTAKGLEDQKNLQSKNTGIYQGESSVVYVYLMLYRLSDDQQYLQYAKKHIDIVKGLVVEDQNHDLLSGNTGFIQVLLLMHKITKETYYLEMAKAVAEILYERAIRLEQGIGWSIDPNIPPMAGLAHGNSGMLMVIAELWKQSGNRKYENWICEILEYENSLYDTTMNNWVDMRNYDQEQDPDGPIAWCHGVGGILLARLHCYAILKELDSPLTKQIVTDMECAYQKLNENWLRDSISLCHGSEGNLWILKDYERRMNVTSEEIGIPKKSIHEVLPQERLNPSVMNGYGGLLLFLLHKELDVSIYNILDVSLEL